MLQFAGSPTAIRVTPDSPREIDLTLADGEIVGLVGPNEAGKSTLCLVAPGWRRRRSAARFEGEVCIDGAR